MWLEWAIVGLFLGIAVLFAPSLKGGRRAYQSGWGGSISMTAVAIALAVMFYIWRTR